MSSFKHGPGPLLIPRAENRKGMEWLPQHKSTVITCTVFPRRIIRVVLDYIVS